MMDAAERQMLAAYERFVACTEDGYAPVFSDQEIVAECVTCLRERLEAVSNA